jgi:hypothetical protein
MPSTTFALTFSVVAFALSRLYSRPADGLFLHATARMNTDDGWVLLTLFEV